MEIAALKPDRLQDYVDRVPLMHGAYYAEHWQLGRFFEDKVRNELTTFAARMDPVSDGVWVALVDDRIEGSITIDGVHLGDRRAHLRWFIVSNTLRGSGAGRQLLEAALAFCDQQGFSAITLWTFAGLDAARHLYEAFGFELVEARTDTTWGRTLTEQRFDRPLA